ncbi:MAG: mechanosensitive ion channel family protein [Hyphomicrobiales bacterium]
MHRRGPWPRLAFWFAALWFTAAALLPFSAAFAQTAPAPSPAPVQLSDDQVNRIVQAVKGAVLDELKANQPTPQNADADTPAAPATSGPPSLAKPSANIEAELVSYLEEEKYLFVEHFETALRAFPDLGSEIGSILSRLDDRPQGRGRGAFFSVVTIALAAAIALAYVVTSFAARLLPMPRAKENDTGVGLVIRRGLVDFAGYGAFWLATIVAARKLFPGHDMQSLVGHWLLWSGAQFALYYTVFLIWFRPADASLRIVPLDDHDARFAMRLFSSVAAVVVLRSWISIPMSDNQPEPVIAAGLLVNNVIFVVGFILAALPAREAIARWISNTAMSEDGTKIRQWLARHWFGLATASVVALGTIHAFGAVSGRPEVSSGLTGTIRIVLAMILVCALVEFIGRRTEASASSAKRAIPKLPGLVSQMLRVFIVLGAAVYFIRLWFVDALGVMTDDEWGDLADYAFEPLAAIFGCYLAISYVNYLAARYLATHPASGAIIGDDGEVVSTSESSRLRTLIPILRVTAIVIIVIVMGLIALSHMGFNVTPLLAGASVIGLAISFGSQALVKDIVSGILFLAEDSFRVGEYIECGKSKGTVEGFTLRSVRLRHQDGQIYTVPFGQLGEIINYSRDWSTVKFNMSLDRDVDLEEVRRVTKKVAATLKADFKDRLLEPLKVQGVKDVTDNAIVVQFKFTSLPLDPGEIERTARSRLLKAFKEDGIALSRPPWMAASAAGAAV